MQKHDFSTVLDCFKVMLFLIFSETFLQLYAKFKILYFFILCENFFDFVRKATTVIEYIETALTTKYSGNRESFEIEDISETEDIILDNYKSEQTKEAIKTLSPIERRLLELTKDSISVNATIPVP